MNEEDFLPCVHCGFCLPACPTYVRLGDENDSPRGRLYLMQAVMEGRLDAAAPAFRVHMDRCLGCLACESVCPSGVEYGRLLEETRVILAAARPHPRVVRLLLRIFGSPLFIDWFLGFSRGLRASGLARLGVRMLPSAKFFASPRFALAMLAASGEGGFRGWPAGARDERGPDIQPDLAGSGGRVAMLVGCVQDGLFGRVNDATARVLRANGYEVVPVLDQRCCGALHAHAGAVEDARSIARENIEAFDRVGVDAIAVNAAGCGASMKDYGRLLADDPDWAERAERVASRVRDVSELLAARGPRVGAPLPQRVSYDAPCHLAHAQGVVEPPLRVLAAIPELEVVEHPGSSECCGGAGIYGLTQPELGSRIGADKVAQLLEAEPDAVVTGNPGCMMQIGAGLLLEGSKVRTYHPVELLDESYRRAGVYNQADFQESTHSFLGTEQR